MLPSVSIFGEGVCMVCCVRTCFCLLLMLGSFLVLSMFVVLSGCWYLYRMLFLDMFLSPNNVMYTVGMFCFNLQSVEGE